MKKTRRRYDRDVMISVISEFEVGKSPAQNARENGIHPCLPSRWRDELDENPEKAFSGNGKKYNQGHSPVQSTPRVDITKSLSLDMFTPKEYYDRSQRLLR